jgi:YihY family inner membrane protein
MSNPYPPQKPIQQKFASASLIEKAKKNASPFMGFFQKFNNDWVMNFSAMLAYNLLMSIFPIALALLAIIGSILGHNLNTTILNDIQHLLPPSVSPNVIVNIINKLNSISGILGIIAVVLAIFFGSRLFIVVENCFDIIYRVRPRTFLPQNIMAILMLLLFIIIIPIMVFTSSAPTLVLSVLQQAPLAPLKAVLRLAPVIYLAGIGGGVLSSFILFIAIYTAVPNRRISFRHSWLGAITASVALELYLLFFPFYASHFLTGYAGQVGFAAILLVFFYYFAVILLLGAEVNAYFSEHICPLPNDLATFTTTLANTLNKDRPASESSQDARPTQQADETHTHEAHAFTNNQG